jgi:hypothetical protein
MELLKNPIKNTLSYGSDLYSGHGAVQSVASLDASGQGDAGNIRKAATTSKLIKSTTGSYAIKTDSIIDKLSGKAKTGDLPVERTEGLFTEKGTVSRITKPVTKIAKGVDKVAEKIGDKIIGEKLTDAVGKVIKSPLKLTKATSKIASSGVAGAAGTVMGGVGGVLSTVDAVNTLSGTGDEDEKAAAVIQGAGGIAGTASAVASGVAALTGTAAANFWNPVGWVAGALAIGGTLVGLMGNSKR